jgi:hypothetical protein
MSAGTLPIEIAMIAIALAWWSGYAIAKANCNQPKNTKSQDDSPDSNIMDK